MPLSYPQVGKAAGEAGEEEGGEGEADAGATVAAGANYDYLLGMALYSLTLEKIQQLEVRPVALRCPLPWAQPWPGYPSCWLQPCKELLVDLVQTPDPLVLRPQTHGLGMRCTPCYPPCPCACRLRQRASMPSWSSCAPQARR